MVLKKFLLFTSLIQISDLQLLQDETVTFSQQHTQQHENTKSWSERDDPSPIWSVIFEEEHFNMTMTQKRVMALTIISKESDLGKDFEFHILPQNQELLKLMNNIITSKDFKTGQSIRSINFTVEALFLGHTKIYVELHRPFRDVERSRQSSDVIILRNIGTLDVLFNVCIGIFVVLLNINFGAVLDLEALKVIVKKPVGPAIGFVGQFLIMPVLAFLIGFIMFRHMIALRLGIFFTGCTPGGGSSNIFTVILNGNLDLSITMTAVSNLAAFGMMPLWIFTLGALIFNDGNLIVPYKTIALMSCSLMVPLCIGIALQKFYPTLAKRSGKLLKPISLFFIVFITIFAFTVNSYIFKLFSWKIIFATSALPWLGYIIAYTLALICRRSRTDALTIAIETGIQNTGIAIFMLNFTLPQPQADMTSAVPVANSMMTPLPLLLLYIVKKIFIRTSIEKTEEPGIKESKFTETKSIAQEEVEMEANVCEKKS